MPDPKPERPFDDPHEMRAFALKTATELRQHTIKLQLEGAESQSLTALVLADAKAFEAFIRTGRIPTSHRIKPTPEASGAADRDAP